MNRSMVLLSTLFVAGFAQSGCGGEETEGCLLQVGNYQCVFKVDGVGAGCDRAIIYKGKTTTSVFVMSADDDRTCKTEQINVPAEWQAGEQVYLGYNGYLHGVASDRIEGNVTYRIGANASGPPECLMSGPLVCIHQ